MKHIIIGTAGHIDHGKTTLIKALTGINTDRLKEEQKRGISIDLGFSHFDIDGQKIGIIDVPGHEKFLKNMLAGVAGIDLVMLIVSADEGVMPQTREHLDILNLIGTKKGIIVVTKIDNVEEEYLELIEDDIKDSVKGTFLENSPVIMVDSISRKGIDSLISKIKEMSLELEEKNTKLPARMYIDRIFTVKGFGNVVTGTLVEGTVKVDDEMMIYPSEKNVKIRGIQVHSEKSDVAYAGQRVAINITGIEKDEIQRGDTLAVVNTMIPSMIIDCKIEVLENALNDIEHWDRVRLYHGSKEILGRIVPLNDRKIKKGTEDYVQIRLEEKIACKSGDKIVIRTYSPMETVAGGTILDPNAKKHSTIDEAILNNLMVKEKGDTKDITESYIYNQIDFVDDKDVIENLSLSSDLLKETKNKLVDDGKIVLIGDKYIHLDKMDDLSDKADKIISDYHKNNHLKKGISKEEFKIKLSTNLKPKEFDLLIGYLSSHINIEVEKNIIKKTTFEVIYSKEEENIKNKILTSITSGEYAPPQSKEYIDNKIKQDILDSLIERDILVNIGEDIIYKKETLDDIINFIRKILMEKREIQISDIRDKYDISRKYIVAILEYSDRIRLTKRLGDKRVPC